jgi:hypothetical protein
MFNPEVYISDSKINDSLLPIGVVEKSDGKARCRN